MGQGQLVSVMFWIVVRIFHGFGKDHLFEMCAVFQITALSINFNVIDVDETSCVCVEGGFLLMVLQTRIISLHIICSMKLPMLSSNEHCMYTCPPMQCYQEI